MSTSPRGSVAAAEEAEDDASTSPGAASYPISATDSSRTCTPAHGKPTHPTWSRAQGLMQKEAAAVSVSP